MATRKPKEVRDDLKRKFKEVALLFTVIRELQYELKLTKNFSPYSTENEKVLGGRLTQDVMYQLGWSDGYNACRIDRQTNAEAREMDGV